MTPKLQAKARDALVQRLLDRDEDLAKQLLFDDPEIRRAAASALASKKAKDKIPDLLKALEDDDLAVVQAVRSALKDLTGQDFGPAANAAPIDHYIAIGQWYAWWHKRDKK